MQKTHTQTRTHTHRDSNEYLIVTFSKNATIKNVPILNYRIQINSIEKKNTKQHGILKQLKGLGCSFVIVYGVILIIRVNLLKHPIRDCHFIGNTGTTLLEKILGRELPL